MIDTAQIICTSFQFLAVIKKIVQFGSLHKSEVTKIIIYATINVWMSLKILILMNFVKCQKKRNEWGYNIVKENQNSWF